MKISQSVPREYNRKNLIDFSRHLDGIEWFVFFGTLLGVVREGDIIENDDDIDLYVNKKDRNKIINQLSSSDFEINLTSWPNNTDCFLQFTRTIESVKTHIDIYLYENKDMEDYIVDKWNFIGSPFNSQNHLHIPKKLVFPITTVDFFGQPIFVPALDKDICVFLYGDSWNIKLSKEKQYITKIINNLPQQVLLSALNTQKIPSIANNVLPNVKGTRISLNEVSQHDEIKKINKSSHISTRPPFVSIYKPLNPRPHWSVMIPAYNPKPEYLNKVLRSVLTNIPRNLDVQIEILDDASPTCNVAALVKKMAGMTKVSVHRNSNNLGYIANWNACIERANGEWVHILHQDDYVLPGFYEKISTGLKLHPEAGAAFCRHNHVSAKDETTFTSALERAEPGILENWPERLSSMQRQQFVSTVVKRSTFEKIGGFWSEARSAADWEMWMRIAAAVPVFFHPEILACFRIHNISESSRLLMSGENSTDTSKAIDLFSQYLPEDKRAELVAAAKNHYARSAFGLALNFLQQKQFLAAAAQVSAALELETSPQNEHIAKEIRNQIPATVLNESTAGASNAAPSQGLVNFFDQEEVSNIEHLVTAFQAAHVDDSAQKPLRDLRNGLADYLLGVQPSDLKSLMGGSYGKVFELILNSGLQDEALSME